MSREQKNSSQDPPPRKGRSIFWSETKGEKKSGSIPGVYRPKYNNTGRLSVKIFTLPGVYRQKYQNTVGSSKINPWIFRGNSDKPRVLGKKPTNLRY